MNDTIVAIALSGGVDSLVSGFLIKKNFKNVFGIHFTTGYEKISLDIKTLENQLGFPVHIVDLSRIFETQVVQYFILTYLKGKTPNPCVICNQKIKFNALWEEARAMGANAIATGHYATIINSLSFPEKKISKPFLAKGMDPLKDQSYFLSMLRPEQLEHIIFPLAGLTKSQVKNLAKENNLTPLTPSESQDICFIHDKDFSKFIFQKKNLGPKPGNIVDLHGKKIGTHQGLHTFTIGQRRGINCPASEPYYVRHKELSTNTLVVCFKKDLTQKQMQVEKIVWNYPLINKNCKTDGINGIKEAKESLGIITKIRYSHKGALSRLTFANNLCHVIFDEPQPAVTPGQTAVFYKDDQVLGAGIIK